MKTHLALVGLILAILLMAGCQQIETSAPTPTLYVVKTVIGQGRDVEGPLSIRKKCVRVNGQGLAWSRYAQGEVKNGVFRFQNGNGQVLILHDGDKVKVWGHCEILGPMGGQICVTPELKAAEATPSCRTGPYFIVDRIQPITTPTPIPPSPSMKKQ